MKLIDCRIKICVFLVFITCQVTLFAKEPGNKNRQQVATAFVVNGKVVDGKGNGLPGASVMQKGQPTATTTAADGSFSITIQEKSAVLVISFVGFQSREVLVNAGTSDIVVELSPSANSLEDVIVVGYGTQR